MAPEDYERIDWLESIVRELDLRILATGTGVELCFGRLTFPGSSLRGAIDQARSHGTAASHKTNRSRVSVGNREVFG